VPRHDGQPRQLVHTAEEIARSASARRAGGEVIGGEHATLGLRIRRSTLPTPQQRLVVDPVREARPDLIITHDPHDYMSDHNEISKLVFECSFHATLPLVETGKPHHGVVTPIYYMDTVFGLGFVPTEYVDERRHRRQGCRA
jgi:LmbE family N-acetylglucosaminyl deacetylase